MVQSLPASRHRWCEEVASSVNRTDESCVVIVLAKLSPHLSYQNIDVSVIRVPFPIADSVHQLISCHDFTGALN